MLSKSIDQSNEQEEDEDEILLEDQQQNGNVFTPPSFREIYKEEVGAATRWRKAYALLITGNAGQTSKVEKAHRSIRDKIQEKK